MKHPFRVREIAVQAGLSEATVDRVLNKRGGVRASTVDQVQQAIEELDRQRSQIRLGGRTFLVDVVAETPQRFSTEVREAFEAAMPTLRPAVMRGRFHFRETWSVEDLVATLEAIARRGSHGVILKAPDVNAVTDAVQRLNQRGIPVVTLTTDLPHSSRIAYIGIDNRAAGATAAYLIDQWLGDRPGDVLITLSSSAFRGEEEREMGFRAAMRASTSNRTIVDITESHGLDEVLRDMVIEALARNRAIKGVYSIGGGNNATLEAFAASDREYLAFIAHDLDRDNVRLLQQRRISAVLHHDLAQDMRNAGLAIIRAQHALPAAPEALPSTIQVITPLNMPSVFPGR
ncbi:LacI family transcriptional regulator [Frankineae bacterium MT45]|nr:LacI family transcriptional regulator [Frankineae bacterium MT45]